MHEGHPVFRVETSSGWDLRARAESAALPLAAAAQPSVSTNDAVVAEVNKQRVATHAFIEQSARLNQQLAGLSQSISQMAELAKQNVAIQRDLTAMRERLSAVDAQLRDRQPSALPRPQKPTEDKW